MYCSNCGAAVVGKFCSCCGKRVRSSLEEYRRVEKSTFKAYMQQFEKHYRDGIHWDLSAEHLISACWYACAQKYGRNDVIRLDNGECVPSPDAYEKLETVKRQATKLCERMLLANDY